MVDVKEFKNGNINIKYDILPNDPEFSNVMCDVLNALDWLDTYDISGITSYGNDCVAIHLYNIRLDKMYMLTSYAIYNRLVKGLTLKLYARTPDDNDKELIKEFYSE